MEDLNNNWREAKRDGEGLLAWQVGFREGLPVMLWYFQSLDITIEWMLSSKDIKRLSKDFEKVMLADRKLRENTIKEADYIVKSPLDRIIDRLVDMMRGQQQ